MFEGKATKLSNGDQAPHFSVTDINGEAVTISKQNEQKILLSFFRYSGCPWCNLAIYRLTQMAPDLENEGIRVVCFVQSPRESIVENVMNRHDPKPPFAIIADPEKTIYNQYAVEENALKYFTSLKQFPEWIHASFTHKFKQMSVDGDATLVPAQFLIDSDGTIIKVHYGTDYADDMTLTEIKEAIRSENYTPFKPEN
ncbi:redoxin domain-containing protein [Candidatus Pacebacteria bacterium]|nr:redoxin domain-containing protein [Candidatus Paceibacterota bacterium]